MSLSSKVWFTAGVAALAFSLAAPAKAAPVLGLSLLIDDSGSISPSDFALQKTGYINALTALLPTDGTVALEVKEFDTTVHSVFSFQMIDAVAKSTLLTALTGLVDHGGNTATGPAILSAQLDLVSVPGLTRRVIDVSTDGFGNVGTNESIASTNAITAGINQVNVLCIGSAANCVFNRGIGSFNLPATFANFESTLKTKLAREINVPEPASLALLGAALVGMFLALRPRKQA